jgi:pseudaminic acid biosynthesis-associated methylase
MSTEQEKFWAGEFGNDYSRRNQGANWVASNTHLFSKIFTHAGKIQSIIEFGSNIGLNLKALKNLYPEAELSAIEINKEAVKELNSISGIKNVYTQSILDFIPDRDWELVLIKGVLIHINPVQLPLVYDLLFKTSGRYICIAEYYNPSPVEIPYRGFKNKLFKRDFAGEILDRFPSLKLINYGFAYHRDPFPQDDLNWFLMEKSDDRL